MLIKEVIERVQSQYSKGVKSDDSRLSNRHIYNKLVSCKNKLVAQQAKKKQKISDWNYIVLPCVELIEVDSHDCPCIPANGCKVYRTKYKLPKTLTDLNMHLIQWVMTVDSSKILDEISREAYLYIAGNKYTSNHLRYILEDGHLYVYGKNISKFIKVKLLAEDPIEAYSFPSGCKKDCVECQDCSSPLDKNFPIDGDLIDTLIEMALQELVVLFSQNQEDQSNNTADTIREQAK